MSTTKPNEKIPTETQPQRSAPPPPAEKPELPDGFIPEFPGDDSGGSPG